LPAAVTAIISRALMRDIQERYQSAAAMRADVEQALAAIAPDAIAQGPALLSKAALEQPAFEAFGHADGGHETPALGVSLSRSRSPSLRQPMLRQPNLRSPSRRHRRRPRRR
jgi:hypothetical protein